MKTLFFKVSDQKLDFVTRPERLIKGTKGYLECAFLFEGDDWNGCKVVAVFDDENAVPVLNGGCMVPDDSANKSVFKIRLIGVSEKYKILTNNIFVEQEG